MPPRPSLRDPSHFVGPSLLHGQGWPWAREATGTIQNRKLMNKYIKIALIVAGCAALGYCIAVGVKIGKIAASRAHLTIVHVNDTHSHLEPEKSGDYVLQGGELERAAYVDSVRKADGPENVLLLHAGDYSQGSSYFSEFGTPLMVQTLNAMKYDVVTLGNHEFDNGIEALADALSGCEMPCVVCNYDFSSIPLGPYVKPYVIVEKAGKKIGVVGVLCSLKSMVSPEISNRLAELDMVSSVQKYVDEIRPQCDLVIALTHLGVEEHNPGDILDDMLCAATRGIDIFVGGHSHTFMDKPMEGRNLDGKKVPIVQTGWMGVNMGEFHVAL